MNKEQIKGRAEESKGNVKEIIGKILDDQDMGNERNIQKNVGQAQAVFGDIKEVLNIRSYQSFIG